MKKYLVASSLLISVVACLSLTANAQMIVGGYQTVANDDARSVKAAQFAVSQKGAKLDSIGKAESQVVAGTNYRLCMAVTSNNTSQHVRAVVYENLKSAYSITSWDVVAGCGEAVKTQAAPYCTGAQLALAEAGDDADMGGKRYVNYVFTNISSKTCMLTGFPKLALFNRAGQTKPEFGAEYSNDFPGGLGEDGNKKPVKVTLEPRKKAWFNIFYNDGMALPRRRPYPTATRVRITAPHDKRIFFLKSQIQTCCGVQVSSVKEGTPN